MPGTVLIVEDEPQVLILAESVLQGAGYETISSSTVAEALAIVESDRHIDVLFTDLGLGDQVEGGLTLGAAFFESHRTVAGMLVSEHRAGGLCHFRRRPA
jgi:CheY-like chemotaxis protein